MHLRTSDWNYHGYIKYLEGDGLAKVKCDNGMLVTATLNNELTKRGVKLSLGDRVRVRCPSRNQRSGLIYWVAGS